MLTDGEQATIQYCHNRLRSKDNWVVEQSRRKSRAFEGGVKVAAVKNEDARGRDIENQQMLTDKR